MSSFYPSRPCFFNKGMKAGSQLGLFRDKGWENVTVVLLWQVFVWITALSDVCGNCKLQRFGCIDRAISWSHVFKKPLKLHAQLRGIPWLVWATLPASLIHFHELCNWSEVSYVEVLGDKSTMHIRVTFYWGYLIVLWLFYLVRILFSGCFNLFCNMWVCVCVGFVLSGCLYMWVL